ncbi:MAG: HU family DNA-binding protein [Burkholderiales bacterium]|nr:HU family DNA-binding protein [Burkholderiales bacterium]
MPTRKPDPWDEQSAFDICVAPPSLFHPERFLLNKTELIAAIAAETDLPKSDVSRVLDAALTNLSQALVRGDAVQLIGFGAFSVSNRAERSGRNPATGEAMTIKASKVSKFTPGKALKDLVNGAD